MSKYVIKNNRLNGLYFPCKNIHKIKEAIERVEMLISMLDCDSLERYWMVKPRRWNVQTYICVNDYALVFRYNKDRHIYRAEIYGPDNGDKPYHYIIINKHNSGEVIDLIQKFEQMI